MVSPGFSSFGEGEGGGQRRHVILRLGEDGPKKEADRVNTQFSRG